MGFAQLQQLMRRRTVKAIDHRDLQSDSKSSKSKANVVDPCIVPKNPATRTCKPPLCAACQIARAKQRPTDVSTTTTPNKALLMIKKRKPGAQVSVDQYKSSVQGRLASSMGRESFLCNHATRYIQCYHQNTLCAADTMISTRAFGRPAKSCGVKIKAYHGNNGIFKPAEFQDTLAKLEQHLKFSGVGAHHQNGVTERSIRAVTEKAQTMMQHAYMHWPHEFQVQLCLL